MRKDLDFFKRNGYFPYPKTMQIEITTMCPLRCPQCFIHEFPHKHMDMQLFKNIIEEASLLGVKSVVLFGGEPLCHPNVEDMINYVICKNITVFIYTSGWKIETLIKIYQSNPKLLKILISLNGSKKEIHELSRNDFALTYIAAQQLGVHDVQYGINWVSRHDNVRDLENLIRIAKDLKAQYINIVGNKMASDYCFRIWRFIKGSIIFSKGIQRGPQTVRNVVNDDKTVVDNFWQRIHFHFFNVTCFFNLF